MAAAKSDGLLRRLRCAHDGAGQLLLTGILGAGLPIARQDDEGNTYQIRKLADGSEHEVLKNFPAETELTEALAPSAENGALTMSSSDHT